MSFLIFTFSRSLCPFPVCRTLAPVDSFRMALLSCLLCGLFILDAAFLRAWLEPKRVEVEPRFGDGHIQTEYIQGRRYSDTPVDPVDGAHNLTCGPEFHRLSRTTSWMFLGRFTHSLS